MNFTLDDFDTILVSSSAGKDSQAMLDFMVRACELAGVRDRMVVVHADLGEEEWPGTKELAAEHAAHYGLRFEVVKRQQRPLLEEIRKRGKWPSNTERYCTSYYKRDQIGKLVTALGREHREKGKKFCRIMSCLGFRAEESPRRRKLPKVSHNKKLNTRNREVIDYLPIQDWTEAQVWERIAQAGTKPHYAYSLGMKRLSCRFCIFAPKGQLMISARQNPELFEKYLAVEKEIGHTFRVALPLAEVKRALDCNEDAPEDDGAWNM